MHILEALSRTEHKPAACIAPGQRSERYVVADGSDLLNRVLVLRRLSCFGTNAL
jgi:hypothetical protein